MDPPRRIVADAEEWELAELLLDWARERFLIPLRKATDDGCELILLQEGQFRSHKEKRSWRLHVNRAIPETLNDVIVGELRAFALGWKAGRKRCPSNP